MNNFVQPGEVLDVAVTHPTTPTSGIPVRMGDLPGAATAAEDSDGNTRVQRKGVVDVSTKAIDDVGNSAIAVFDRIYYVDADTPVLSKKASGRLYGFALETVTAGSTATINVLLAEFSPTAAGSDVQYAEVAITAAQIKLIRGAPITLVAAPGAGYVLEMLGGLAILDYGSEVFTESDDNLIVNYTDGSGAAVSVPLESASFLVAAADTIINIIPVADCICVANAALVMHNDGDGEIAGNASDDSVIRVKLAYRVHATGL